MTLPFDPNQNKNIKKYQCFVCGVLFTEYGEFKNHILEEHEEGRDFVKCPVEHCQAPVRDMKMHIKAKHPQIDWRKIPGQHKALVWHDFSPKGEKKTRKPRFRKGKYLSTKMQKLFTYNSGLEEKVFQLLDDYKQIEAFEVEPFRIPY